VSRKGKTTINNVIIINRSTAGLPKKNQREEKTECLPKQNQKEEKTKRRAELNKKRLVGRKDLEEHSLKDLGYTSLLPLPIAASASATSLLGIRN
jgi:hypothetical protein